MQSATPSPSVQIVCDQYWPEGRAQYGQVEVSLASTEKLAHFTVRRFAVSGPGLGSRQQGRSLVQLQYTSWPAGAANPANPLPLLTFIRTALKVGVRWTQSAQ